MNKGFKRIAASFLSAAMLFQQCAVTGIAEEEQAPEVQTQAAETQPEETQAAEVQTQAAPEETQADEPETQAPTEPQTQAPTEPQTQAPTEPQTQEPTEPETQAPTEPQTQAPTEPETQAPTEPETQPATESETQAPTETETETASETETETVKETETETEKQTERSERINDGEKIELQTLRQGLQGAFPYLLAAQEVTGASLAEEEEIASGDTGRTALSGLEKLSEKLADGKSTSKVRVLNVYADKDGKLDTKQLKDAFQSETVDVTNQYVVVNVIADQKDQKLNFSGYTMVNAGQTVRYSEETQPGDILYNFSWLDGENFAPFEGTVTLTGTEVLQGTFLAPEGDIEVKSNLAGAVYADKITVADSVSDLKRIVLIEGRKRRTQSQRARPPRIPRQRSQQKPPQRPKRRSQASQPKRLKQRSQLSQPQRPR